MSGEVDGDLPALLANIVSQTQPDAQYALYHAKHLELLVQNAEKQPARYVADNFFNKAQCLICKRNWQCSGLQH